VVFLRRPSQTGWEPTPRRRNPPANDVHFAPLRTAAARLGRFQLQDHPAGNHARMDQAVNFLSQEMAERNFFRRPATPGNVREIDQMVGFHELRATAAAMWSALML